MKACRYCGSEVGHLGACPEISKSEADFSLWETGYSQAKQGVVISMWTIWEYPSVFQLGYKAGRKELTNPITVASLPAVMSLN